MKVSFITFIFSTLYSAYCNWLINKHACVVLAVFWLCHDFCGSKDELTIRLVQSNLRSRNSFANLFIYFELVGGNFYTLVHIMAACLH